jgi:hypothetical protein
MRGKRAGASTRIATVAAIAAALALAGCSDVDDALFGPPDQSAAVVRPIHADPGENPPPATEVASTEPSAAPTAALSQAPSPPPQAEAPPPPQTDNSAPLAGTLPPAGGASYAGDLGPRIAAISIEPGRDTGTPVAKTTAALREQAASLESKLMENAHHLGQIRIDNARLISTYQNTRAQIMTRLQIGTTPANPDLVSAWNAAQSALDQLAGNLNGTGAIGTAEASDSTSAQQLLQQISTASNTGGAADEDHRELATLDDEVRQMQISIERLRKEVAADVPRETTFLASERASLTQLQAAIRTGEPYSANAVSSAPRYAATPMPRVADNAKPLVVIKFDSPHVDYQQSLYAALNQALQTKPSAAFEVLAVAPTGQTASAVAAAQTSAKRHAHDVVQTMAQMGVPAGRVQVASSTDPTVQQSEVRVFVR